MLRCIQPIVRRWSNDVVLDFRVSCREVDEMDERIREIAEECCRSGRIDMLNLPHLRPYLESFLDSHWLDTELRVYERWASRDSDPFLQSSILHRPLGMNVIIAMIWAARYWGEIYRDDASFIPPGGAKRLIHFACSLAVLELNASAHLDSEARELIQQRLRDAHGFFSMVHEIHTFAYFIRKGAQVEPRFLRKASPEELIVQLQGHSISVQCKSKKPGAGRCISQDDFTTLAGSIARDVRVGGRPLLIRIGTKNDIRQQDIDFLRRQVSSGVGSGEEPTLISNDGREFTLQVKPLSERYTVHSIQDYLSSFRFHVGMVIGEPAPNGVDYNTVVVVGIDAKLQESVRSFRSLRESVKRGAKPLEGGLPGIVAVHYADPVRDFEDLCPSSQPMREEMGRLMDKYPHVAAVMLSSEPDLQLPQSTTLGEAKLYYREPWWAADLLGQRV